MSEAVAPELESVARAALAEVAPPETVGDLLEAVEPEEQVVDLAFDSRLPGYVGWRWTVSLARLPDEPPSVLEVELLPGDSALVAPSWVPWAERLAEYRRTHPDEQVDALEGIDEDEDLDADEDALEETDDELDGVEFETPADDDEAALDEDDDELPIDDDESDDEDDDEPEGDEPEEDEAFHGPEDERLRGD